MHGSELRKKYVVKKKEAKNLFVNRSCERLAMLEASNEIAIALAKKYIFLMVKILLNPVCIKLQNGLVINVLKESKQNHSFKADNHTTH